MYFHWDAASRLGLPRRHVVAGIPDDLFARVALKNGLVTQQQIDVARRGAAESGKSLRDVLVAQEALTKQKADAVAAAIERKMAEKRPPEEAPAETPPPPKQPAAGGQKSGLEHEYDQNEAEIKRLIRHIVTSTLHQKLLEHVVQGRISVLEPNSLAVRAGVSKTEVPRVLKRWQRFRVARALGGGTYNFSPGDKERKTIELFLRCWKWPELHGKLLSYVLEQASK